MAIEVTDSGMLKTGPVFKNFSPPSEKKGHSKKYIYIYGIPIVLFFALTSFFLRDTLFSPAVEVMLTTAQFQSSSQIYTVLTANGFIEAQRKAAVASKGTGKLVYLGFEEGDKVKKNQIIATLEDRDIRAQLLQARSNLKLYEADLKEAENNYKRQQILLKSGATTRMEMELSEAHYNKVLASIEAAKAGVSASEAALENTLIRSPFDGTILIKNADIGEVVAPSTAGMNSKSAVFTIADMSTLQVDTEVPESDLEKVTLKQNCEITIDAYPDRTYSGYVDKIIPTADRSKATIPVKVALSNCDEKVLPEMKAKVTFLSPLADMNSKRPILVIPVTAVKKTNGRQTVYFISNDKAKRLFINTGKQFGNYVEVIAGISNGDQIIDNLNEKISDGTKVKIKK